MTGQAPPEKLHSMARCHKVQMRKHMQGRSVPEQRIQPDTMPELLLEQTMQDCCTTGSPCFRRISLSANASASTCSLHMSCHKIVMCGCALCFCQAVQ